MIYDYLFYKSYQLALRSKNFEDTPVLGGLWGMLACFGFNIYTLLFLFDAFFESRFSGIFYSLKYYKFIFGFVLVGLLLFYFKYNNRWKKIIAKYDEKELKSGRSIHPAIVLLFAYVLSFTLLVLSGMLKNQSGIFKR